MTGIQHDITTRLQQYTDFTDKQIETIITHLPAALSVDLTEGLQIMTADELQQEIDEATGNAKQEAWNNAAYAINDGVLGRDWIKPEHIKVFQDCIDRVAENGF